MMESPADLENSVVVGVASPPTNKVAAQLTKLRDANTKYKNLLKMAKERIEQQEQELKRLKGRHTVTMTVDCLARTYVSCSQLKPKIKRKTR